MNFLLLFAFLVSLSNLIKDLIKGHKENIIDVYFDIIFIIITFVPFLINIVVFKKCQINHVAEFKKNFYSTFLMDYYERFRSKRIERGEWLYCNQAINESILYTPKAIFTMEETEQSIISLTALFTGGSNWVGSHLNDELMLSFLRNCNFFQTISGIDGMRILKVITWTIKDGEFICALKTIDKDLEFVKMQLVFSMEDQLNDLLDFVYFCHSRALENNHFIEIEIGEINIRLNRPFDIVKIKSHKNLIDEGISVDIKMLSEEQKFLMLCHFSLWSKNPKLGTFLGPSLKSNLPLRNGFKILHALSITEIISFYNSGYVFEPLLNEKGETFYIEGGEIVSSIKQKDAYDGYSCSGPQDLSIVDEFFYNKILLDKLSEKFGCPLAEFLLKFTNLHFPNGNEKAIDYLLNRSSCRNYRCIGPNWKSKRYLADVCYIFEIAGVPRLTHIDRKIPPTKMVIGMTNFIPKSEFEINRSFIKYDCPDIVEYKETAIKDIRENKDLTKQQKKTMSMEISKKIKSVNNNVKHRDFNKNYNEFLLKGKTTSDNLINKILFREKNEFDHKAVIKSTVVLNKTEDYISYRPKKGQSPNQNNKLLKSKTKIDFELESIEIDKKKKIQDYKRKLLETKVSETKKRNLPLVKDTLENLKLISKGDKHYKGNFKIVKEDQKVTLNNYFSILENYVEQVEEEEKQNCPKGESFKKDEIMVVLNELYMSLKLDGFKISKKRFRSLYTSLLDSGKTKISKYLLNQIKEFLGPYMIYTGVDTELILDRIIKTTMTDNLSYKIGKTYKALTAEEKKFRLKSEKKKKKRKTKIGEGKEKKSRGSGIKRNFDSIVDTDLDTNITTKKQKMTKFRTTVKIVKLRKLLRNLRTTNSLNLREEQIIYNKEKEVRERNRKEKEKEKILENEKNEKNKDRINSTKNSIKSSIIVLRNKCHEMNNKLENDSNILKLSRKLKYKNPGYDLSKEVGIEDYKVSDDIYWHCKLGESADIRIIGGEHKYSYNNKSKPKTNYIERGFFVYEKGVKVPMDKYCGGIFEWSYLEFIIKNEGLDLKTPIKILNTEQKLLTKLIKNR